VRILELGRTVHADEEGHYVFRGLAPGRYTVTTGGSGAGATRQVEVPSGPAAVRGTDLVAAGPGLLVRSEGGQ
jgi:hypothetical protein